MRSMKWTSLCSAVAGVVFAASAMAQDCATAPTAVIGANAFDTTASAVNVAMPAGSGCATSHTIYKVGYYKFTAATAGVHTIAFCGGATFDTRVAVLNTCDPAGGVLACNDDSCGLQSQTAVNLTAGQQCVILYGGYGATNFGAGSFTITEPTAGGGCGPGSDTPPVLVMGDNLFANTATGTIVAMAGLCDPGPAGDDNFYNTNYYKFTPAESGTYRLSTCNLVDFDSRIAIMNNCDPNQGVLACNDDGAGCAGFSSFIAGVDLVAGTTYSVVIGGYNAGTIAGSGTFSISMNTGGGCLAATPLVEGLNPFSTVGSSETVDLTGVCDPGPAGDDLVYNAAFYTFTPTTSAAYQISTCNLAAFDTRIAVMNTCVVSDGVLACNDDGAGCATFSSFIPAVDLSAGVTYYIVLGGYSATDSGSGQIEISLFVPCSLPAQSGFETELCGEDLNGGCNNAAGGFPTEPIAVGNIILGTFWADAGTRDTDWYSLTLTEGTEVTLSIASSLNCFTAIVDTGCGGIVGGASVGSCPSTTSVCLAAGTYYVVCLPSAFEGYTCGGAVGNDYTISVTGIPCAAKPPANDLCANAVVAIEGANPFDNTFAGTEVVGATCGFGGTAFTKDVWFTFTATQDGDYNFSTCLGATPFDTGIEIYDACPDAGGVLLGCNDDGAGCAAFASNLNFAMTIGMNRTIRVAGWGGAVGATDLTITFVGDAPSCGDPGIGSCCTAQTTPFCDDATCCNQICAADPFCCNTIWDQVCANAAIAGCTNCQVAPPVNDECAAAINLPLGVTAFSTLGATGTTVACLKFGNTNVYNDLWYVHTATGNSTIKISLCGSLFDTKIAAFEDSCTGALVACNDDAIAPAACAGTLQSELVFTAVCGKTYYISIGAFSATGFGSGTANVTQLGTCAPPCPTDFNNDQRTNFLDLAIILNGWGTPYPDLNGDGNVANQDLSIFLNGWGLCP